MRIALGCMRSPPERAAATMKAALAAGITLFDTARAYGESEAVLGATLGSSKVRVVTKCGMRDGWVPDGRARSILEDARASHAALGRPADVLLLHAPDPRTPLATSVRALVRAVDEGHARAIGLSNVSLRELDLACGIAPIAVIEVALGAFDDLPARSGLVAACGQRGIEVLAYSVFGGPRRAARLLRDSVLVHIARETASTPARVFLAYLRAVHVALTPIVGATRPETAADVGEVSLDDSALARLDTRFEGLGRLRSPPPVPIASDREVVMIMGLAGAGKSRLAATLGGTRLNRDAMGGTLRGVVSAIKTRLDAGDRRIVVDNTYLGRAVRADVIGAAHARGARVRCVFLDTSTEDAEMNIVLRMLERHGALLGPEELARAAKTEPGLFGPITLFRMGAELERPVMDEGFEDIEVVPFQREPWPARTGGLAIPLELLLDPALNVRPHAADLIARAPGPILAFGWQTTRDVAAAGTALASVTDREIAVAVCEHPEGPPRCWCRPPLPGLFVAWALRRQIDPGRTVLVGSTPAHAALARKVGATLSAFSGPDRGDLATG